MPIERVTAEDRQHISDFQEAVNMTANELENWLKTEDSLSVGQKSSDDAEATGHQSGRNIVKLLHKRKAEYTTDDVQEMRRVVSYVHRHMAQRPEGNVSQTRWRYSLMNWGHDPLKDK